MALPIDSVQMAPAGMVISDGTCSRAGPTVSMGGCSQFAHGSSPAIPMTARGVAAGREVAVAGATGLRGIGILHRNIRDSDRHGPERGLRLWPGDRKNRDLRKRCS